MAVVITDNAFVDSSAVSCSQPTTMHESWTVTGAAAGETVVVDMTGPGLPASANFVIGADGTFGHDYTVPAGPGLWTTTVVSIGGLAAPAATATDTSAVTCH